MERALDIIYKRWPECVNWGERVEVEVHRPTPRSPLGLDIYNYQDPEVKDVNYNMIYEVKDGPVKETKLVQSGYRIVQVGEWDATKVGKEQVIRYLKGAGQDFVMVVCPPLKEINKKRLPTWSMAEHPVELTKTALDSDLEFSFTNYHNIAEKEEARITKLILVSDATGSASSQLKRGDMIVSVNGTKASGHYTAEGVRQLLKKAPTGTVRLLIKRREISDMLLEALGKNPQLIEWSAQKEVKIQKDKGRIGVQISCVQVSDKVSCVYVHTVQSKKTAENLSRGDRILKVNKKRFGLTTLEDTTEILKQSSKNLKLLIATPLQLSEEVVYFRSGSSSSSSHQLHISGRSDTGSNTTPGSNDSPFSIRRDVQEVLQQARTSSSDADEGDSKNYPYLTDERRTVHESSPVSSERTIMNPIEPDQISEEYPSVFDGSEKRSDSLYGSSVPSNSSSSLSESGYRREEVLESAEMPASDADEADSENNPYLTGECKTVHEGFPVSSRREIKNPIEPDQSEAYSSVSDESEKNPDPLPQSSDAADDLSEVSGNPKKGKDYYKSPSSPAVELDDCPFVFDDKKMVYIDSPVPMDGIPNLIEQEESSSTKVDEKDLEDTEDKKKGLPNSLLNHPPGRSVDCTSVNEDDLGHVSSNPQEETDPKGGNSNRSPHALCSEPNPVAVQEKPRQCSGYKHVLDMEAFVISEICKKVSLKTITGGFNDMVDKMGFSWQERDNMREWPHPVEDTIKRWAQMRKKTDGKLPNLRDLCEVFHAIGRDDIVLIIGTKIPCQAREDHIISHDRF